VLPAIAAHRGGLAVRWVAAYALVISTLTYQVYACDKRRAEAGEWRLPEAWLHLMDLLGGWPGGLLAQRRLRHKCAKASYQFIFWLGVFAYQFAAYDSLQDWKVSRAGLDWIQLHANHRRGETDR
jgi:uncharacterized membrane protein YsdA (DUF1294 family)